MLIIALMLLSSCPKNGDKARFLMSSNILIYAIRGTELWWRAVSEGMWKQVTLVSDVKTRPTNIQTATHSLITKKKI